MEIKVAPSMLSADFRYLADQVRAVEDAGADFIHLDVMDGHFVPNITFGPMVVNAIRQVTDLPLDVHLMITDPDRYLKAFSSAGANFITVHAEACTHLHRTITRIKELGVQPGVALNPATPLDNIKYVLSDLNLVLLMTVNPGFARQEFIRGVIPKIRKLRELISEVGFECFVEVDGGINPETARLVGQAGADVLVAGSAVFGAPNLAEAIHSIRYNAKRAQLV
ncbi:MAG: ribulose-phosphate 3-epimerase [Gemmatimonadetes bacterium]|nr:MAG: ribulose-phosphate 3-epimerase [Gemmatimonadota bacterium]